MLMTHQPYPPEFREQMVKLVCSGRPSQEPAREFEPSGQSIRNRVGQADRDDNRSHDGLTSTEREELRRHPYRDNLRNPEQRGRPVPRALHSSRRVSCMRR